MTIVRFKHFRFSKIEKPEANLNRLAQGIDRSPHLMLHLLSIIVHLCTISNSLTGLFLSHRKPQSVMMPFIYGRE